MNLSNSEYSSGCESGWTMYLDQLSNISTNDPFVTNFEGKKSVNEDYEDEDLSMVSDASSGPPHYFHEYDEKIKKKSREKSKTKETIINKAKKQHNLCLDDTASSPVFDFSQGESITKKHFSFFKSSTKGKSGSLLGRKRQ
ncbi:hypothetical protein DH2020_035453 [Rehmannia glutinosa]|uniref:Uncharacterized protein n=1 Tax=Rehmannia glutinosa TaxID=99300 RepID=A0ABR0V9V2_REHGL